MKEKIFTRNFGFTFLSMFFSAMVMYMLMATITEYATALGATVMLAGLVSGIYIFGGFCSRLYSGHGLEKIGWKRFAIIAMVVHLLACSCYFFVNNIVLLIIIRFIHGLGFGATSNALMAIGMSILPKSRYGEATGYFMLSTTLAVALGPYTGGLVIDHFGAAGCFTMATVQSLLMLVFILFVDINAIDPRNRLNKKTSSNKNPNIVVANKKASVEPHRGLNKLLEVKAIPVSLCMFMCAFGYVAIMSFYRLYSVETDLTAEFSYFFLIYASILFVSRLAIGKLQDKFGDNIICIPCIIAQFIGLSLIAWYPCMLTIIICAFGCALGFGTLSSVFNVIVCNQALPERRPYAITTLMLCCDGGVGIGPFILGAVATVTGYQIMYYCAAAITLIALPVYVFSYGRSVVKRLGRMSLLR